MHYRQSFLDAGCFQAIASEDFVNADSNNEKKAISGNAKYGNTFVIKIDFDVLNCVLNFGVLKYVCD